MANVCFHQTGTSRPEYFLIYLSEFVVTESSKLMRLDINRDVEIIHLRICVFLSLLCIFLEKADTRWFPGGAIVLSVVDCDPAR